MRAWYFSWLLAATALPSSCGGTPAQPATAASRAGSPSASFDSPAPFPPPATSGVAPAAAAEPNRGSAFHTVLTSPYPSPSVLAWPGGALPYTHALVVTVKGSEVVQRASWLGGLPELVSWDADVTIELPPDGRVESNLPSGTLLSVHAGNRHGPDESRIWDGKAWSAKIPAEDPRIRAAYRDINRFPIARKRLSGGRVMLVRPAERGGLESLLFEPGNMPARVSPIASKGSDYQAWLSGSAESLRLCLPGGEIFAWRDDKWTGEKGAESGAILGCAVTSSGTVWIVDAKGGVAKRSGDDWEQVPMPANAQASAIEAGGDRIWITAGERVLSTEPVARELRVEEGQLPGAVYFGISGLDATGPDLLNVSADPAGPGTAACDSLVLVIGAKPGSAVRSALQSDPAASRLDLFEAQGSEGGTLFVPPGAGAQMKLRPSRRTRKAWYLVPTGFDEGLRILGLVRNAGGEPKPALLCAIPRNARKLGPVSSMRE